MECLTLYSAGGWCVCRCQVEVLEYPELGMEAIWKIEVENFPAFIVVDDKGNDFFKVRPHYLNEHDTTHMARLVLY